MGKIVKIAEKIQLNNDMELFDELAVDLTGPSFFVCHMYYLHVYILSIIPQSAGKVKHPQHRKLFAGGEKKEAFFWWMCQNSPLKKK